MYCVICIMARINDTNLLYLCDAIIAKFMMSSRTIEEIL